MTIDRSMAARLQGRSLAWRLGASTTAAIGVVLVAWALSIDVVRANNNGFFGDAATYYSLGHSLADDFDFQYQREDLVRVWREYPGGPEGLFLKRGSDAHLYYAKSFIYPLFASPFIWLFGTNGFLVFNALLMTGSFACAYAFLSARSHPVAALIFAFAFCFVSVTPVYMIQIAPDFFNFAIVLFAFFFWCFKEVNPPVTDTTPLSWKTRWLLSPRSDVVASVLLGVAMFSKPTQIMLIAPLAASALLRRQWGRAAKIVGVFVVVAIALFGLNIAVTGEWNYQSGDRKTFYSIARTPAGEVHDGFPFQDERHTFDSTGLGDRSGGGVLTDVLLTRDALLRVFPHNLWYFVVGRHAGFAIYFFPGVLAALMFLWATRDRAIWQWMTFLAGVGSAIALLLYMPFTYSGGGGPVGNRYFLGSYGVFLFLVPPLQTAISGLLATAVSAMFVAPILSNPFYAITHPQDHSKTGIFRWLPTELTMVNDLPINVAPNRIKQPLGGSDTRPPMLAYFLDDNVYNREGDAFWVRGESSADIILRAPIQPESQELGIRQSPTSLHIEKLTATFETGPKPSRVVISTGGDRRIVDMAPSSQQTVELAMPRGVPYKYDPRFPTNYIYFVTISSSTGFVPLFESGAPDSRFLGVMVRLVPVYGAAQ